MRFTKMHGVGNDYVYIDCMKGVPAHPEQLAISMSDRHFGIGSDGLVLILPSQVADFRMRMFNADGSEAQMCGNASRCVGKYVYDNGLTDKTEITLETKAGIKPMRLTVVDGKVHRYVSIWESRCWNPFAYRSLFRVNVQWRYHWNFPAQLLR